MAGIENPYRDRLVFLLLEREMFAPAGQRAVASFKRSGGRDRHAFLRKLAEAHQLDSDVGEGIAEAIYSTANWKYLFLSFAREWRGAVPEHGMEQEIEAVRKRFAIAQNIVVPENRVYIDVALTRLDFFVVAFIALRSEFLDLGSITPPREETIKAKISERIKGILDRQDGERTVFDAYLIFTNMILQENFKYSFEHFAREAMLIEPRATMRMSELDLHVSNISSAGKELLGFLKPDQVARIRIDSLGAERYGTLFSHNGLQPETIAYILDLEESELRGEDVSVENFAVEWALKSVSDANTRREKVRDAMYAKMTYG